MYQRPLRPQALPKKPKVRTPLPVRTKKAPSNWGFVGKDYVTIGISVFSLSIAGLTGFMNVIRQSDEVRMTVSGYYLLTPIKAGRRSLYGDPKFTFTNSGTRTVAVTGATVEVFERSFNQIEGGKECDPRPPIAVARIPIQFTPITIKTGDIQTISFSVESNDQYAEFGKRLLDAPYLSACVTLAVETISERSTILRPLYAYPTFVSPGPDSQFVRNQDGGFLPGILLYKDDEPLISRWGTIFTQVK